jgi:hypothetical protein
MFGTSRLWEPSDFFTSTAKPRLTWGWRMTPGFPSTGAKLEFMTGIRPKALTMAQPIRWVKLILPCRWTRTR